MLYDAEPQSIDINVPRMRRGEGTFAVLRIRNRTDLLALADLLDEPRLRMMKPDTTMSLQWHADSKTRDGLSDLFQD